MIGYKATQRIMIPGKPGQICIAFLWPITQSAETTKLTCDSNPAKNGHWDLNPLLIEMTHLVSGFIETRVLYWRRQWHPTPVLLPGKSQGRRSLVSYSPWGHEESDTTEWLHFHFSLSCIGEGNGNPLQCSCLENPRNGGAWWAAFYGVAQLHMTDVT